MLKSISNVMWFTPLKNVAFKETHFWNNALKKKSEKKIFSEFILN